MDASDWDDRYAGADLVWSETPNVFVADQLADRRPGRALDLAGGEGRNAIWLARQGWTVELVEFSRVALDKAVLRAEAAEVGLTCTLADLTAPPPLGPADLVLLAYLQLPRAQARAVVRFAASLVAPDGWLLLVAHARRNLTDGVGGPGDPDVLVDPDELRADLDGTGLEIEVADEVVRNVGTDSGPREAIDVLLRAVRPA